MYTPAIFSSCRCSAEKSMPFPVVTPVTTMLVAFPSNFGPITVSTTAPNASRSASMPRQRSGPR